MPILQAIDRRAARYGLVLVLCILSVIAIDLITNELNTTRFFWDFALYYDMAEFGLIGNDYLWAPFVYRFATPLIAGLMSDALSLSVLASFQVIAGFCAVVQLFLVFVLAEHVGARLAHGLVAAAVVALSLYNIKFLIFDVSRPDHLAYPLMVIAVLALFRRNIVACVAVSCVGLLVREFLIIPPAILVLMLAREYWQTRSWTAVGWLVFVCVSVSLFVIVPRALIPIQGSGQYIDPINDPDSLSVLWNAPLSKRRDVNLLFNLLSYTLPLLVLLTVGRIRRAWRALAGYRLFLVVYTVLVLVLAMYGGTDIWRFMSYLFIPQIIVLVIVLRDDVDTAEVLYMLAVVAIYNKIGQDIPNVHGPYLDFYGGYDNRINAATLARLFELAVYIFGAVLLRALLMLSRRGWRLGRSTAAG
ncbi:MAG: hypothetical protein JXJ20_00170 [Anaerolineae bacterium]|nr:hypothetical protein [Anaerolineae bacterium]